MAAFDAWAEYYDLIHQGLPGEAEFYIGQAVRRGGRVLELGCGTGRIAIPMAMSGLDVTGLDNSGPMLDMCRYKMSAIGPTRGTVTLVQDDMSDFELHDTFTTIAMAYRTFMHLLTPDQQRRSLRAVRRHLAPDGMFIMNTWRPNLATLIPPTRGKSPGFREAGRYDAGDVTVVHRVRTGIDEYRQLLIEDHQVSEIDGDGRVVREASLPMVRAWTTLRELKHLVELEGLRAEAVFGDFDANALSEQSTEMIWVLRRDDANE